MKTENIEKILKRKNPNISIINEFKDGNLFFYEYMCNVHENKNTVELGSLLKIDKGSICKDCGVINDKLISKNTIRDKTPELVKFLKNESEADKYTFKSDGHIDLICPICMNEKQLLITSFTRFGFNCLFCGKGFSKPEKFCENLLKQLNIDFIHQYSPNWSDKK
jgi:hypothetical protein